MPQAGARRRDRRRLTASQNGGWHLDELCATLISDVAAHTRVLVNGQVAVSAGGQLKVPTPRVDQFLVKVGPPRARAGLVSLGAVSYGVRVAIAAKMGLPIAGPVGPPTAPGWAFGPSPEGWELVDPTRTLIARCKVVPESADDERTSGLTGRQDRTRVDRLGTQVEASQDW